jgi:hypothetical protein
VLAVDNLCSYRTSQSRATVEVVLTDGCTFVIHSPDHVGGSARGRRVMLPSGDDGMLLVEVGMTDE